MSPKRRKRRVDYWHDPDAPEPTSRTPSASVVVRDQAGRVLLLRRPDNGLWTIPSGGVKTHETVAQAAVRECREETGVEVEVTGLVGVFSTPAHVVAILKGGKVKQVRQPVNICLHARPVGGTLSRTAEADDVAWVAPDELEGFDIHPAIRLRLSHGLSSAGPYLG